MSSVVESYVVQVFKKSPLSSTEKWFDSAEYSNRSSAVKQARLGYSKLRLKQNGVRVIYRQTSETAIWFPFDDRDGKREGGK